MFCLKSLLEEKAYLINIDVIFSNLDSVANKQIKFFKHFVSHIKQTVPDHDIFEEKSYVSRLVQSTHL